MRSHTLYAIHAVDPQKSQVTVGPPPAPQNAVDGDVWFNTEDNSFYQVLAPTCRSPSVPHDCWPFDALCGKIFKPNVLKTRPESLHFLGGGQYIVFSSFQATPTNTYIPVRIGHRMEERESSIGPTNSNSQRNRRADRCVPHIHMRAGGGGC
jgi:hypothetical protein